MESPLNKSLEDARKRAQALKNEVLKELARIEREVNSYASDKKCNWGHVGVLDNIVRKLIDLRT